MQCHGEYRRTRMRTIVHIGQHKTGTTALQYALSGNRKALSRARILYLFSGVLSTAHR
jgi:hypothetical protein